jgi:hypothetical protein
MKPSAHRRLVYRYSQGWEYQEIKRFGVSNLFRVRIRRDSYDMQSMACLEKWSDSNGWVTFSCLPSVKTLPFMEIPPHIVEKEFWKGDRDWFDLFKQTGEILWERCAEFFGPQYDWAGYGWAGQERGS